MKFSKKFNLVSAILMLSSSSVNAQVPLLTDTVDKIGSAIAADIYTVIDDLEQSGRTLSFSVRSDLLLAADNIALLVAKERGKTFQQLNATQQAVFNNTLLAIEKTKQGTDESLKEVRSLTNQVGTDISRLPFAEKTPFVTSYDPGFFIQGRSQYRISVAGSRLGEPTPHLKIPNANCTMPQNNESNAVFVCSGPAFDVDEPTYINGKLTFFSKRKFFVGKRKARTYSISTGIVPEKLGDYKLSVDYETNTKKRIDRVGRNSHRNSHCESDRTRRWTHSPASGCAIDVTTVSARAYSRSQNTSYEGVTNLTSTGFTVGGRVRNRGDCIFGRGDARGSLGVEAKWVDICESAGQKNAEAESGELFWNQSQSWRLGEYVGENDLPLGFTLKVTSISGDTKVITGADTNEWLDVNYDPVTKVVVLTPNSPRGNFIKN